MNKYDDIFKEPKTEEFQLTSLLVVIIITLTIALISTYSNCYWDKL